MGTIKKYKEQPDSVHIEDPDADSYRLKLPGVLSPDSFDNPPKRGEWCEMSWENPQLDLDAVAHRHMRAERDAEYEARRPTEMDLAADEWEDRRRGR